MKIIPASRVGFLLGRNINKNGRNIFLLGRNGRNKVEMVKSPFHINYAPFPVILYKLYIIRCIFVFLYFVELMSMHSMQALNEHDNYFQSIENIFLSLYHYM